VVVFWYLYPRRSRTGRCEASNEGETGRVSTDTSERVFGAALGNEVVSRRRGGTPPWGYYRSKNSFTGVLLFCGQGDLDSVRDNLFVKLNEGREGFLRAPTRSRGATHRKLRSLAFYSRPSHPSLSIKQNPHRKGVEFCFFVGREGFEPPKAEADRFTVCCNRPLYHLPMYLRPFFKLSHLSGSNRRPTVYKTVALPTELRWLLKLIQLLITPLFWSRVSLIDEF
jgi:hypothetical protein